MGFADKSHDNIPLGGFLQNDFGMAGRYDLRAIGCSNFCKKIVDIPLA